MRFFIPPKNPTKVSSYNTTVVYPSLSCNFLVCCWMIWAWSRIEDKALISEDKCKKAFSSGYCVWLIFPDHTLLPGHTCHFLAGQTPNDFHRARPRPLSLISRGFIPCASPRWNFVPAFLFTTHRPFSSQSHLLGSCLACAGPSSKCCRGGKSDKTARPRSLCKDTKLGAARKCLNLKFTAQVTGSLQLSFNGRNF